MTSTTCDAADRAGVPERDEHGLDEHRDVRTVIITDGLMQSPPVQISFGGGMRLGFNDQYSAALAASEIRTALPWRSEPKPRATFGSTEDAEETESTSNAAKVTQSAIPAASGCTRPMRAI